jgi:UDP-N-acetylmuramate dehydrogenase
MSFQSGLEHVLREAESLAPFTWLRLGGAAEYFAEPTNLEELTELVARCRQEEIPVRLVGGGSNLLVRDEGVRGLVLHLSAAQFGQVTVDGGSLQAGGGAKLSHVIAASVREGLAGLEALVGIPGTVGGALHGNATSHGANIGSYAHSVTVITHGGEVCTRTRDEMLFAYRSSNLDELVILDARFDLEAADSGELTKQMQKLWIVNKANQPLPDQRTAMLFKDHGGMSAAALIEEAGLQKSQVGGVELSERNANYVVAGSKATSRDILELTDLLREGILQRLGIELEMAVDVW